MSISPLDYRRERWNVDEVVFLYDAVFSGYVVVQRELSEKVSKYYYAFDVNLAFSSSAGGSRAAPTQPDVGARPDALGITASNSHEAHYIKHSKKCNPITYSEFRVTSGIAYTRRCLATTFRSITGQNARNSGYLTIMPTHCERCWHYSSFLIRGGVNPTAA